MKFFKNFVFQVYDLENIKLGASERRSINIVPKMVVVPKICIKISFDHWKRAHLFMPTNFNEMNELFNYDFFCYLK